MGHVLIASRGSDDVVVTNVSIYPLLLVHRFHRIAFYYDPCLHRRSDKHSQHDILCQHRVQQRTSGRRHRPQGICGVHGQRIRALPLVHHRKLCRRPPPHRHRRLPVQRRGSGFRRQEPLRRRQAPPGPGQLRHVTLRNLRNVPDQSPPEGARGQVRRGRADGAGLFHRREESAAGCHRPGGMEGLLRGCCCCRVRTGRSARHVLHDR
mmetsp:Transcript_23575/g.44809  ORF Transcript_23575/g.44809 Transcript_23575/m.44809 type:complete len:208 (-) Transcript_23575:2320-2943(-)